jgi:hypothetical protein
MSNNSTDTLGFGPVEEFADVAIIDRAQLEILEKQLKRPRPGSETAHPSQESSPKNGTLGPKPEAEQRGICEGEKSV